MSSHAPAPRTISVRINKIGRPRKFVTAYDIEAGDLVVVNDAELGEVVRVVVRAEDVL